MFNKTSKQKEATAIMADPLVKHFMAMGGSRSGKTALIIRNIIIRACKAKSRHISLRATFNSAKTSIWMDTLPKVMDLAFPNLPHELNRSDYVLYLPNGSEYWIGGLDSKDRVEKILGKEYSTMHFNECSQLNYKDVLVALSRLAEKNKLKKMALYDQNPPSKKHWSYWMWIKHWNPFSEMGLNENEYRHVFMNPSDNIENIDKDYLRLLEAMPEKEKQRFLLGQFTDAEEGLIYYAFNDDLNIIDSYQPKPDRPLWIGMDFNVNPMTAVVGQLLGDRLVIFEELFLRNSNTQDMCNQLIAKFGKGHYVCPDSTGKKETTNSSKSDHAILKQNGFQVKSANNPFRVDRYSAVNTQLHNRNIVFTKNCKYTISDLNTLSYKEGTNKPDLISPDLGHITDALGYLVWRTINPFKAKPKPIKAF